MIKIKKTYNKNAIVLPEVLRIIIAVACILLLMYLAFKLYGIFIAKSDLEKAKAELTNIEGKIKALKEDKSNNLAVSSEYLLFSPREWVLTGWPYQSKGGEIVHVLYCASKGWTKCICMCDATGSVINKVKPKTIAESCNINKVCFDVSEISKLKVNPINPLSVLWGLFEFGGSDVAPIYIKKLGEDFKGDLNITYYKSTKELDIIPMKK